MNKQRIRLNFLPLEEQSFEFKIWRKEYAGESKKDMEEELFRYSLPVSGDDLDKRKDYWISFRPIEGFEEFICLQNHNHYLTQYYLYKLLSRKVLEDLKTRQVIIPQKGFNKRIMFVLRVYNEGKEVIWLEPYYLRPSKKFGFLIDFKFLKNPDIPYSREIQRLSLTLDKDYRSNRNFYIDKFSKIEIFLNEFADKLFPLNDGNMQLHLKRSLEYVPADFLNVKSYVFAGEKESKSQYTGVEEFGPLETLSEPVVLLFVYRNHDKVFIDDLIYGLEGNSKFIRFPGLRRMFRMEIENIEHLNLDGDVSQVVNKVKELKVHSKKVIPIITIDRNKDNEFYYSLKYQLLKLGIPIQVVTSQLLRNKYTLKWALSGIALQIFAKLGGKPWKVRPSMEKSIILGIGQAHQKVEGKIKKFFAYSVCTDSSGIYKKIGVLGNSISEEDYYQQLRKNIILIAEEFIQEGYQNIVLHVPFRICRRELEEINKALQELSQNLERSQEKLNLIVIRINRETKFFGYAETNSMIPFESTFIQLQHNPSTYLVWFEGLQFHNRKVVKLVPGPILIQFWWANKTLNKEEERKYLQDVLNLSGANWRGFNAKNLPVSVYYSQLVAKFLTKFPSELDNISEIQNPWFL